MLKVVNICLLLSALVLQLINGSPFFGNNINMPTGASNVGSAANTVVSSAGQFANDVSPFKTRIPRGSEDVTLAATALLKIGTLVPTQFTAFFKTLGNAPSNRSIETTCLFADLNKTIDMVLDVNSELEASLAALDSSMSTEVANTMRAALECTYQQTLVIQNNLDLLSGGITTLRQNGVVVSTTNVLSGLPASNLTNLTNAIKAVNVCLLDLERVVAKASTLVQVADKILVDHNNTVNAEKSKIASFITSSTTTLLDYYKSFTRAVKDTQNNVRLAYEPFTARLKAYTRMNLTNVAISANATAVSENATFETYLQTIVATDYENSVIIDIMTEPKGINYMLEQSNTAINEFATSVLSNASANVATCAGNSANSVNRLLESTISRIGTLCATPALNQIRTALNHASTSVLDNLKLHALLYSTYINQCLQIAATWTTSVSANAQLQFCLDAEVAASGGLTNDVNALIGSAQRYVLDNLLLIANRVDACVTVRGNEFDALLENIKSEFTTCTV